MAALDFRLLFALHFCIGHINAVQVQEAVNILVVRLVVGMTALPSRPVAQMHTRQRSISRKPE
jgi:hypothetical protein